MRSWCRCGQSSVPAADIASGVPGECGILTQRFDTVEVEMAKCDQAAQRCDDRAAASPLGTSRMVPVDRKHPAEAFAEIEGV